MPYYFWVITWKKEANNFQKAKVQNKGVRFCLFFFLFQPGVAYKSVAYKEACSYIEVLMGFINSRSSHWRYSIKIAFLKKFEIFTVFFNKVAEQLRTTAFVTPSLQCTLFKNHSIFNFSLEYLWSHERSVWKLPSNCLPD